MGGIPTKEQQEINERLTRIEAALQQQGGGSAGRPDPISPPVPSPPPKKRGTHFTEDDPVHGTPIAGAKFRARSEGASPETQARSPTKKSDGASHPKFAVPTTERSAAEASVQQPKVAGEGGAPSKSTAKAERTKFFGDMHTVTQWNEVKKCPGVKCTWLASLAAALSVAAGEQVTMEDILKVNEAALHYVSMPAVTTAEVFDLANDFIKSKRELRDKVAVDVANFDGEILDEDEQVGDEKGSGDRPPIQSLIQFRKTLAAELVDESFSVHIVNFDPYPVQEAEAKAAEDEEALAELEEQEAAEENQGLADSMTLEAKKQSQKQWQPKNMGSFAILTNYNAALHTVTIVSPHLAPDGTYTLESHQCPLQTLYNACCVKDGYTKRSRGFVRVFRVDGQQARAVKAKYPVALIDGRQSRGMLSIALDISISSHVLGLGLLHLVVQTEVLDGSDASCANGGIELRGIPVTSVCDKLGLPVGTIVGTSTRDSLPTAAVWYKRFLAASGLQDKVSVGCVTLNRRDDSDDGAVNIDEDDFFEFLEQANADSKVAVLFAFNVNVARNVRVVPDGSSPTHFGVLMGFDKERGMVQIADVSVKKYRKVWHTTPDLLYRAVIGHGYIVAASAGHELVKRFNGEEEVAGYAGLARYGVQNVGSLSRTTRAMSFEHPAKNYSMTVVAKGLNAVLRAPKVRVEDLIYGSGFHISFMLSEHLPILATHRAAAYYCYYALEDAVYPETTIADAGNTTFNEQFEKAVLEATKDDSESAVLVNYFGAGLNRFPLVWNGSFGGNIAVVLGYDKETSTLLLEDSNPEPFYRRWACPLSIMQQCMAETDPIADRPRGFMVLCKGKNPLMQDSRLIDMRRAQSHHPFKNPVSSIASAIALALSEVLPGSAVASEEVIYAGGNFALKAITSEVTPVGALTMCEDWLAQNPVQKKKVKIVLDNKEIADEAAFLAAVQQQGDRVSLIMYDAKAIFPGISEAGLAAGVVTRAVEGRDVVVCDGSPTRHGDLWARPASVMHKATKAILQFTAI